MGYKSDWSARGSHQIFDHKVGNHLEQRKIQNDIQHGFNHHDQPRLVDKEIEIGDDTVYREHREFNQCYRTIGKKKLEQVNRNYKDGDEGQHIS